MPGADPSSYTLLDRNPFDIHVYFRDLNERERAVALRDHLHTAFSWLRLFPIHDVPIGPHPWPHWEADFLEHGNSAKWEEVIEFLTVNHKGLSVLVHPHTTDGGLADHTTHAFWIGVKLDLITSLF